nr:recombinase family protein [uncultured Tyzzerella sp.]
MKKYKVSMYLRISCEDSNKKESESITNQKSMIQTFIDEREDLELVSIKIDDGYSGGNFERPAFKELMEEVKSKKVDCIIVKDFSRFGRNFIEVGKYIEEIFPFLEVRFISINDGYDSINNNSEQSLIVPFKNLINDAYLRDISIKIRTQLDSKRKNGEFIGSFAPYGYLKDPKNKNKLIIDDYASKIVQEIFEMKLEGYTHTKIAEKLNNRGVLSPMEYKKHIGLNFKNSVKSKKASLWSHKTIIDILKSKAYIGVLEQAKFTSLNYRVKKLVKNPEEKWLICEDTHQPIIDKQTFEIVQSLMLSDTRVAPNNEKVSLFSGILYCADCGRSMVRKNFGTKENRNINYVCSGCIKGNGCTKHSIKETVINETLLKTINLHIKTLIDAEKIMKHIKSQPFNENQIENINANISTGKKEIDKLKEYKFKVYEDYKNEILDKNEYIRYNGIIEQKLKNLEESIKDFEIKLDDLINGNKQELELNEYINKYKNIKELDRKLIVCLISRIYIYENLRICVKFRFNEQYGKTINLLSNLKELKEVI